LISVSEKETKYMLRKFRWSKTYHPKIRSKPL